MKIGSSRLFSNSPTRFITQSRCRRSVYVQLPLISSNMEEQWERERERELRENKRSRLRLVVKAFVKQRRKKGRITRGPPGKVAIRDWSWRRASRSRGLYEFVESSKLDRADLPGSKDRSVINNENRISKSHGFDISSNSFSAGGRDSPLSNRSILGRDFTLTFPRLMIQHGHYPSQSVLLYDSPNSIMNNVSNLSNSCVSFNRRSNSNFLDVRASA